MSLSVTHFSRDDVTGGAARCAKRLHDGLLSIGVSSRMVVARRRGHDPTVIRYRPGATFAARQLQRLKRRGIETALARYRGSMPRDTELFSDDRCALSDDPLGLAAGSGVMNLHWVSGFLDIGAVLARCSIEQPIVWTLHDMNLFTGGCHYDHGCARFVNRCGQCPQLGSNDSRDLSRAILDRKERAFSEVPSGALHLVTPSRWLAGEVGRSSTLGSRFPVSVIPYGLDTDVLCPRPKRAAREALGLPVDARIVLFVAQAIDNPRKGFPLLLRALGQLTDVERLFLLSIGGGARSTEFGLPRRQLGYTTDDDLLAAVYSAADVFVTPTLQDNLPATVLEAMACGTAVVGFNVGGVPEMIRDGRTGFLADGADEGSLEAMIRKAFVSNDALDRMGREARAVAQQEYGLKLQATRYADLYRTLGRQVQGDCR